ncbi:hypothetical protein [Lactiplantibacillus argentoratensis]|uniref:hypothetical protein n=1 Tax=Lactiplantibacillus argentoratensis TaxID=271881 RepID=UPI0021AA2A2A|nr:hypothetical protein [Lactiplantibacillus argentoratensis]
MTKQRRLAYDAIKVVSQGNRGAVSKLIAVLDVSRQTYYQGLKRQETEWESHDRVLKARTQYWFNFHRRGIGAGNLLTRTRQPDNRPRYVQNGSSGDT